jgi:hypothetical protein
MVAIFYWLFLALVLLFLLGPLWRMCTYSLHNRYANHPMLAEVRMFVPKAGRKFGVFFSRSAFLFWVLWLLVDYFVVGPSLYGTILFWLFLSNAIVAIFFSGSADRKERESVYEHEDSVRRFFTKPRDMEHLAEAAGWDPEEVRATAAACAPSEVQTDDPKVIKAFQALFDRTFKQVSTRDRRGQPVPERLVVESVTRVINRKIWEEYTLRREMVLYADGAKGGSARKVGAFPKKAPLTADWVASEAAAAGLDFSLREDVNEAILFHGTTKAAAKAIARDDFRLNLSGSPAGTLFGRGIYLAESVSKSDE